MPNLSSVDWDTAWRTCKELNATLPVILSEKGQLELRDFVGDYLSIQAVWTAGRYVGSKWSWLNGQDLSGTGNRAYVIFQILYAQEKCLLFVVLSCKILTLFTLLAAGSEIDSS